MNVTIFGAGYVGLVTAACLAELGNTVVCFDPDRARVALLQQGEVPIHERGLPALVRENLANGRLAFTSEARPAVLHGDFIFIAVGTPPAEDGSADLQHVLDAARTIGVHMDRFKVVVDKSTVPVGTAERVRAAVEEELLLRGARLSFSVVSNPEFLKEGAAVDDFMRPDRIVLGVEASEQGERAADLLRLLYAPFNRHHGRTYWMDTRSAEFTKYAANAMLATRISFMNELANLADDVGVDIEAVRQGVGADSRIGHSFLYAGCGYGGSCFPKDISALLSTADEAGRTLRILQAVEQVNHHQKRILGQKLLRRFGPDLRGRHFALWGLAFKPNTDDMREATSVVLLEQLLAAGASVAAYDPVAQETARMALAADVRFSSDMLGRLSFAATPLAAAEGADALLIATEWKEFRSPDFARLKEALNAPVIFDGRNLYEPEMMAELGIEYDGIGRRVRAAEPDLVFFWQADRPVLHAGDAAGHA
ncbi:MAG TPA: UDP-glucose/GDP-mannose dehydrogenase family protein [Telluria sp.]|nr:UDP-glucose/GDP-mannose dehydrogenase family protein [Telluria sp.]